ncbi:MAG: ABC transporter ATP-binding protein [Candidatus Marinimicrobia bacterium]|jgi:ABC-2 type transport system ATP-binding protein|nr:ABC transporter ATP-binding protein [Candidatus Neomarinimicrobiota bacterium]
MEASITFKKVSQLLDGQSVLAGLSFGIERNSTVAIIGDNDDSGLTEFLRIIAGLNDPDYGSLYIHGLDSIKRRSKIRDLIGYIPFKNDMDPWLTAEQNINFINSFYNVENKKLKENYKYYIDALGLNDKIKVEVNKLSPGALRKLTLLRELSRDPKILVLDHPTAFMNAKDQSLTWDILHSLHNKLTMIYSSTSLSKIEKLHDRILVFHNGKVDLDDNLDNMLKNWMGYYQFTIQFEKNLTPLFDKIERVQDIISPVKKENTLIFNANDRSVLLRVMTLLVGVTITDINMKRFHLRDLLAARYIREGIV